MKRQKSVDETDISDVVGYFVTRRTNGADREGTPDASAGAVRIRTDVRKGLGERTYAAAYW